MTNGEIERIAIANGFNLKMQPDGSMTLNPYVFNFARAMLSVAPPSELVKAAEIAHTWLLYLNNNIEPPPARAAANNLRAALDKVKS